MIADLVIGSSLEGLRQLERNALRVRNAVKYFTGAEWTPVAPTPWSSHGQKRCQYFC